MFGASESRRGHWQEGEGDPEYIFDYTLRNLINVMNSVSVLVKQEIELDFTQKHLNT